MSNLKNNIKDILTIECNKKYLLLFVGNTFRSDDGIAPYIAGQLSNNADNIKILNVEDKPELYLDDIINVKPNKTIIFDAANFNGEPGEIRCIPVENINNMTLSTHTFPLGAIAELIKQDTGADVYFIGIQPKNVGFGENISSEIKTSADEIIKFLNMEVKKCMN